jgi:hypothetical protein
MGALRRWLVMSGVTFQLLLGAAEVKAELTYVAGVKDITGSVTSHNFSIDCGAGGNVVVGLCGGTGTISSVTIGGQTATIQVQTTNNVGGRIALATASGVPAGVQTVAETMSVVNTNWDCFTYTLQGAGSLTPTATGSDSDVVGGSSFNTSNVLKGCTLGYTMCTNGGAVTWSGLTTDAEVGTGISRSSPAHDNYVAANAARAVTTSFGGSGNQTASVWASWGP